MRNDSPDPIRCAVCGRGGPYAVFYNPNGQFNWIDSSGRMYMVCNDHAGTVSVTQERGFKPVFHSDPTLRDLEQRIARLEEDRVRP